MKNKIIGIDLDDTISDIRDSMHEAAFTFANLKGLKIIDDTKYLVGEKYGFTKNELEEFFKNYRIKIVENAKVRENAKDVLRKLIDLGYKIIIITQEILKIMIIHMNLRKNGWI